jgi:hypothetical protein
MNNIFVQLVFVLSFLIIAASLVIIARFMRKKEKALKSVFDEHTKHKEEALLWWESLSDQEKQRILEKTRIQKWLLLPAHKRTNLFCICVLGLVGVSFALTHILHSTAINLILFPVNVALLILTLQNESQAKKMGKNIDVLSLHLISLLYAKEQKQEKKHKSTTHRL